MDKVQEQAIQSVMGRLNLTANDVNRYIADAVLEYDLLKDEITTLRAENAAFRADIEAGRLVRYPCRPGDTIWTIWCDVPEMSTHGERVDCMLDEGNGPSPCKNYDYEGPGAISGAAGDDYYLTHEDAEAARAALKK